MGKMDIIWGYKVMPIKFAKVVGLLVGGIKAKLHLRSVLWQLYGK